LNSESIINFFLWWRRKKAKLPLHLQHGIRGERAAKKLLKKRGMKYLTANFKSDYGEIDLIFRDKDCLVFIEVKTRSQENWTRPATAVDGQKKWRLSKTALYYLRLLKNPRIKFRFDIVEVLLEGERVKEIRHIENAFPLSTPYRYG